MGGAISTTATSDVNSPEEEESFTHLMVLVHGFKGTEEDYAYLQTTVERQAHQNSNVVVHRSACNIGKTTDGIENGGKRLAEEVEEQINKIEGAVRLSFVANSMGGLYARNAIAHIDMERVTPLIFCTTSTPHLGVCNHTYIPLPRWAETTIGNMMYDTGRDLFCMTTIVHEMGTRDFYLDPLRKFHKRIAVGNAFATDSLVPVATAAFLSKNSDYEHITLPSKEAYLLTLQTEPGQDHDKEEMSQSLDSLGWTKIFLDLRDRIPLPSIRIPFTEAATIPDKSVWTSKELFPVLNQVSGRWQIPVGHTVAIANSRNDLYTRFTASGQPFMDQVAQDLLTLMGVPFSSNDQEDDDTADAPADAPQREASECENTDAPAGEVPACNDAPAGEVPASNDADASQGGVPAYSDALHPEF